MSRARFAVRASCSSCIPIGWKRGATYIPPGEVARSAKRNGWRSASLLRRLAVVSSTFCSTRCFSTQTPASEMAGQLNVAPDCGPGDIFGDTGGPDVVALLICVRPRILHFKPAMNVGIGTGASRMAMGRKISHAHGIFLAAQIGTERAGSQALLVAARGRDGAALGRKSFEGRGSEFIQVQAWTLGLFVLAVLGGHRLSGHPKPKTSSGRIRERGATPSRAFHFPYGHRIMLSIFRSKGPLSLSPRAWGG